MGRLPLAVLVLAFAVFACSSSNDGDSSGGSGGGGVAAGGAGGGGAGGTGGTGGTGGSDHPFALTGPHQQLDCESCHLDPDDRTVLGCPDCHTGAPNRHADVPGFEDIGAACILCHPDAFVYLVSRHGPFLLPHGHGVSCPECHQARRADKPYAAIEYGEHTCASSTCHSGAPHHRTEDCSTCHPSGVADDD